MVSVASRAQEIEDGVTRYQHVKVMLPFSLNANFQNPKIENGEYRTHPMWVMGRRSNYSCICASKFYNNVCNDNSSVTAQCLNEAKMEKLTLSIIAVSSLTFNFNFSKLIPFF